jgi:hypothetical protein
MAVMVTAMKSILFLFLLALLSSAYEVAILDKGKCFLNFCVPHPSYTFVKPDYDRQVCSGMWASQSTYINGI